MGLPVWFPEVELFAFDVGVHCCSLLVVKLCENPTCGSSTPCSSKAFHTLLCSIVSNAFFKSVAATQSGWCQSAALCLSCWIVNKWSVVELGQHIGWRLVWVVDA